MELAASEPRCDSSSRYLVAAAATAVAATAAIATAETAATAAVAAETTAAAAEAAGTLFTWTGHVDDHVAAAPRLLVQTFDSSLGFDVRSHFDKAEALGTAGIALHHDLGGSDSAERGKLLCQIVVTDGVREVTDVEFVVHG